MSSKGSLVLEKNILLTKPISRSPTKPKSKALDLKFSNSNNGIFGKE